MLAIYDLFRSRHEEARRRLRRALDLDPNSAFVHGCLGASYAFAGDYEAALSHCEEAIRLSPRDPALDYLAPEQGVGRAALGAL